MSCGLFFHCLGFYPRRSLGCRGDYEIERLAVNWAHFDNSNEESNLTAASRAARESVPAKEALRCLGADSQWQVRELGTDGRWQQPRG